MVLIHKSYKRTGKKPCTRCGSVLPKDHTGRPICRTCLDKGGIDAVCKTCGVTFQTTSRNPNKTTRTCPKCRRANPKDRLAQHEPPPPNGEELSPAARELASRALARKYLWAFVLRHDPKYMVGWFHRDLSSRLERFLKQVEDKQSPRLMIQVPPRHGKSRLASQEFPAWLLGHHPEWEIITSSYAVSLPVDFSRNIRERLRDETYKATFPKTILHPESQSVESWRTTDGGGFLAAGVGGPITGKGANIFIIDDPCIAAGSLVITARGDIPIEDVAVGDLVLTHKGRWRKVLGVHDNGAKETVALSTSGGKQIHLTPEHLVYTSNGWSKASEAQDVYTMQTMWDGIQTPESDAEILQSSMFRGFAANFSKNLPSLRSVFSAAKRVCADLLQLSMPRRLAGNAQTTDLQGLRNAVCERGVFPEVLHAHMSRNDVGQGAKSCATECDSAQRSAVKATEAGGSGDGRSALRLVRRVLQACAHLPTSLFRAVQERIACSAYARKEQPKLSAWVSDRSASSPVSQTDLSADTSSIPNLRGVWHPGVTCRPPPGREQDQRRSVQPDCVVRLVPHEVSQVKRQGLARVFDLTVEGDNSFVAGGVVVHNCKNAEEAESLTIRNAVWNWYTSTAYTRLAPGGGILVIQTRWHTDDLSGRIEQQMLEEGGEPWEIVRYPAISVEDERFRKANEALHPERYSLESLERIKKAVGPRVWNALYQQNPVPDEGAYFTRSMIRTYEKAPELLDIYNTWDLAVGQKQQNDWSVGVKWGVDSNDNIYVLDVLRGRFDAAELVDHILDMWKSAKTQACGIEEGQIKLTLGPFLEQRVKERRMHSFHHVPLKPGRQDKVARARTLQGRMRQGQVYFPAEANWMDKLLDELLAFPFGKHDDQVDGLAYAAIMAADVTPPQIETSAAIDTTVKWKQRLLGYVSGKKQPRPWMAA